MQRLLIIFWFVCYECAGTSTLVPILTRLLVSGARFEGVFGAFGRGKTLGIGEILLVAQLH